MQTKKQYSITLICKEKDAGEMVRVSKCDGHFKCPHCDLTLTYIPSSRTLGMHGRTKDTLRHDLRQVTEVA